MHYNQSQHHFGTTIILMISQQDVLYYGPKAYNVTYFIKVNLYISTTYLLTAYLHFYI